MFVKEVLENGGSLHPLFIDPSYTMGTGIMNPSIYVDNDRLLLNIRHINYTLFHSEKKVITHPWGPVHYVHPENDLHLRTINYLGELSNDYSWKYYSRVDTSLLDKDPLWEFVGLEDGRIVRWDDKLYLSGVRRDTTTNGQGRMELSEIIQEGNSFKEISRVRLPAPDNDNTYCEKNWMPILDKPYQYVKWCNPTQVVKVCKDGGPTVSLHIGDYQYYSYDFRGSSQVIPYKDHYICLVHSCLLYTSDTGRRDARYRHLFIVWDKNWNVVRYGEPFSFLGGEIEFCCGLCLWKNKFLITFGFQDNSSFLLECPVDFIEKKIFKN
jgi:hypothetical protein